MNPIPPQEGRVPDVRPPEAERGESAVTLSIDGRRVRAPQGSSLLQAARGAGIEIPALCHHEALEPAGACRLCMVDVSRGSGEGSPRMVAACLYPVEEGLAVRTDTARVRAVRREILELLLARCPDSPPIRRLAREYGISEGAYPPSAEPTSCILCGLCTRVCDALGPAAISLVGRGIGREVAPPFHQPPPDCIGCLACATICPTGHIPFERSEAGHTVWGQTFPLSRCPSCGRPHRTAAEIDYWAARRGVPRDDLARCEACKRAALVETIVRMTEGG